MVTGHAGLAVGTSGEIATLFAHAAVHTCAVAITLASCKEQRQTFGFPPLENTASLTFFKEANVLFL